MFTYHENRMLAIESGTLRFPNKVRIRMEFSPNAIFGDQVPGLTCPTGSTVRNSWNANTGRCHAESNPPLPGTDVEIALDDVSIKIYRGFLKATFECTSREQLVGVLGALHFVAPVSLSLAFADPVIPIVTSGHVGDASFVWQVQESRGSFEVITKSMRDSRCTQAIEYLPVLCNPDNRRLLAACTYLQKAARLTSTGNGPSEFAGEAVVNMAKSLEVLFPGSQSRNSVRDGLKTIGYENLEIEEKFLPALILRSKLDAAHVRMATLRADERRQLQIYLEQSIGNFREALTKITKAVAESRLQLAAHKDERKPGDEISKILDNIGGTSSINRHP